MNHKPGRNDPCPCGSGKKYKNCCMLKEKEQAAAKYTAAGKRKFKARVLSTTDKSLSVFSRSATGPQEIPTQSDTLEKLKFRMTNKDYQVKEEAQGETPSFQHEPTEKAPETRERHLPKPGEEFKPTQEDFREKQE